MSDLPRSTAMYCAGLGLDVLESFDDHEGFDGVALGASGAPHHLELTSRRTRPVVPRPTEEDLLVFYLPDGDEWDLRCAAMRAAGFRQVPSFNPYWDLRGSTFRDPDGYRVVLQREPWTSSESAGAHDPNKTEMRMIDRPEPVRAAGLGPARRTLPPLEERSMRITGVCGSLAATSSNRLLLRAAAACALEGVEVVSFEGVRELPHFDPDLEAAGPPAAVHAWRRALADTDAVLIASPEYGHSLPGALKNAIDWVIGTGELYRKVVGITAAVPHASRGLRGLEALARTLGAVDAILVWSAPLVHDHGIFGADLGAMLRALVSEVRRRDRPAL